MHVTFDFFRNGIACFSNSLHVPLPSSTVPPGQLYSPDDQCKLIWGPKSYLCRVNLFFISYELKQIKCLLGNRSSTLYIIWSIIIINQLGYRVCSVWFNLILMIIIRLLHEIYMYTNGSYTYDLILMKFGIILFWRGASLETSDRFVLPCTVAIQTAEVIVFYIPPPGGLPVEIKRYIFNLILNEPLNKILIRVLQNSRLYWILFWLFVLL